MRGGEGEPAAAPPPPHAAGAHEMNKARRKKRKKGDALLSCMASAGEGEGDGEEFVGKGLGEATAKRFRTEGAAKRKPRHDPNHPGQQPPHPLLPPKKAASPQVRFGVAVEAKGPKPHMEDTHCLRPFHPFPFPATPTRHQAECGVFGVFDGHCGRRVAQRLADGFADTLARCVRDLLRGGHERNAELWERALVNAHHEEDREFLAVANQHEWADGATTCVVVVDNGHVHVANAGDTRAVLCSEGKAVRLSVDHKPDVPSERQRVQERGGRVVFAGVWRVFGNRMGLAVSRSIGDRLMKHPTQLVISTPDVRSERLKAGDEFVVIASDGVWDVVGDDEAVTIVRAHVERVGGSTKCSDERVWGDAAQLLLDKAVGLGSEDNITVVVLPLHWE